MPQVEVSQLPQVLQVGDGLDLVVAEIEPFQFNQPIDLLWNKLDVVILE